MVRVTCYLRPHKLEDVKTAVSNLEISGLTVTDVRGCGNSAEAPSQLAGRDILIALPIRSKLEVVVQDGLQEAVIAAVIASARTGAPGDGKIFVEPIQDAVRIRTNERGEAAV